MREHNHHKHEYHHEKDKVCTDGCCDTHDAKSVANALVYTCPMHPEVVSDKAGSCPKCGMYLVEKKQKDAYE